MKEQVDKIGVRFSASVKQTVTDALIEAMDKAEGMEHVLILSIGKGDLPSKFFTDGEQTIAETNWMIDRFKNYLFAERE
jgi:hypothetical protein